jgi:hypothetical protein
MLAEKEPTKDCRAACCHAPTVPFSHHEEPGCSFPKPGGCNIIFIFTIPKPVEQRVAHWGSACRARVVAFEPRPDAQRVEPVPAREERVVLLVAAHFKTYMALIRGQVQPAIGNTTLAVLCTLDFARLAVAVHSFARRR